MKKRKLLLLLTVSAMLGSLLVVSAAPVVYGHDGSSKMPANADKILAALIQQGKVDRGAPPSVKEAAVQSYLQLKSKGGGPDSKSNPLARKHLKANEEALNALTPGAIRGKKLGNTVSVPPSTPKFQALEGTEKLLLIAVDFSDTAYAWQPSAGPARTEAGPRANQIPEPDNSFDLWVPNFSTQHYEDMLFTPGGWTLPAGTPYYAGQHRGSMRDYFVEQSFGKFAIEGDAFGWFTVDKPEAYYGDDHPGGGEDNLLPGTPQDLLADAVAVANGSSAIDWLAYDLLDLYDLDGDGDVNEPDCIVDHPLFIHAGIDQSGGGGAQGDDSIWAHSSSVWEPVSASVKPGATCQWGYTIIYNYTIMPEDGGVGVFAHEFAHDLGLPDEYDTIYSGAGPSQGFWTLQSTGSWIGRPAQTQPADMSIWAKYSLGWAVPGDNLAVISSNSLTKDPVGLRLEQAERWGGAGTLNGVRISLPPKKFSVNVPHSGTWEWFGGKADQLDTTLTRTVDLTGKSSATMSFWAWYDIEEFWDYGFVQVSTDGGTTWTSLPIAGTTSDHDPSAESAIVANLPGFTGSSGGWVGKTADLSAYAGQSVQIRFRYMTDLYTTLTGFFVDDISVVADGATIFVDTVESVDPGWTADGWTRDQGWSWKTHYYLMEWRNLNPMESLYGSSTIVNFDNGLTNAYQYDPYGSTGNPNEPWYYSYSPGLLLYYRDTSYTDNWTGMHPGAGFLLVVDSHTGVIARPSTNEPFTSRVQTYDSTFSLSRANDIMIGYYGRAKTYQGSSAIPNFDDKWSYWNSKMPWHSAKTPTYGIIFRVAGQAADGSAAVIGIGRK